MHVAITDGLILEYSNAGNKLLTAFTWIALQLMLQNIKHLCLNHVGVTTMERLDQSHLDRHVLAWIWTYFLSHRWIALWQTAIATAYAFVLRKLYTRGLQFYTVFGISIGITQRMIDIGKKITFYFLQNVRKCTVFFAFAFKVSKKCYYDPKKFFLENIIMGIKKTQNFMLISNSLMPAFRNAPNTS